MHKEGEDNICILDGRKEAQYHDRNVVLKGDMKWSKDGRYSGLKGEIFQWGEGGILTGEGIFGQKKIDENMRNWRK